LNAKLPELISRRLCARSVDPNSAGMGRPLHGSQLLGVGNLCLAVGCSVANWPCSGINSGTAGRLAIDSLHVLCSAVSATFRVIVEWSVVLGSRWPIVASLWRLLTVREGFRKFGLSRSPCLLSSLRVLPNPSVKRSAAGRPPGPGWRYAVHCRQPGPGVLPSSPAYLER
jgi:hypothetical protein